MKPAVIFIVLVFSIAFPIQAVAHVEQCKLPDGASKCARSDADTVKGQAARQGTAIQRVRRVPYVPPVSIERPPPASSLPSRSVPLPALQSDNKPQSPTAINTCDAGGCRDSSGNRYNGGTGGTYMTPGGKPCIRMGAWMQCN